MLRISDDTIRPKSFNLSVGGLSERGCPEFKSNAMPERENVLRFPALNGYDSVRYPACRTSRELTVLCRSL